jgi:hypothetical protein
MRVENKLVDNWLNLNLSLAGLSWPLYIGSQVSMIRSGSIKLQCLYMISSRISTIAMIGHNSHWTITRTGCKGTKIMGLSSYTLVSSPRDSTRIVDLG